MPSSFFRALLVAGCTLSLLTFSACTEEAETPIEDEMESAEEIEAEATDDLDANATADDTITVIEEDVVDGAVDSLNADGTVDGQ
jgi:hypothetical protein